MKIMLFALYGYDPKKAHFGGNTFIRHISNYLEKRGHEAIVYAPTDTFYPKDFHRGLLFLISKSIANLHQVKKIWEAVEREKPDLIVVNTNFSSFVLLLTNFRRKIILNLHADSLANLSEVRGDPLIKRFLMSFIDWFYYTFSDYTISTLHGLKHLLIKRYGADPRKILVVPYGVDISHFKRVRRAIPKTKKIFVYIGGITYKQDLGRFLRLIKPVWNRPDVEFRLIGRGSEKEKIMEFIKLNNIKNICVFNEISYNYIPKALSAADFGVVVLKNHPALKYAPPSKTWEYMAAGKPILAYGPPGGVLDRYITNNELGVFLKNDADVIKIVNKLIRNYQKYSKNCLRHVKKEDVTVSGEIFLKTCKKILKIRKG